MNNLPGCCPYCGHGLPIEYYAGQPQTAATCPHCGKSLIRYTMSTTTTEDVADFNYKGEEHP